MSEIAGLEQEIKERVFKPGRIVYIEAALDPNGFASITQPQTEPVKGVNPHDYNPEFKVEITATGVKFPIAPLTVPVFTEEQIREGVFNAPQSKTVVYVMAEVGSDGKSALVMHPKTPSVGGVSRHAFIPDFQIMSTGERIELAFSSNISVLTAEQARQGTLNAPVSSLN